MQMYQEKSDMSPTQLTALEIAIKCVIDTRMGNQQECDDDNNEQPRSNTVDDREKTDRGVGKTGRTTGKRTGWTGRFQGRYCREEIFEGSEEEEEDSKVNVAPGHCEPRIRRTGEEGVRHHEQPKKERQD